MRSPRDERALRDIQREAKKHGATLESGGKGGLPSTEARDIFRRDEYRCKKCGGNQNLSLHHKGRLEHPASSWLKKKAKGDDENGLAVICKDCHDDIHRQDREKDK